MTRRQVKIGDRLSNHGSVWEVGSVTKDGIRFIDRNTGDLERTAWPWTYPADALLKTIELWKHIDGTPICAPDFGLPPERTALEQCHDIIIAGLRNDVSRLTAELVSERQKCMRLADEVTSMSRTNAHVMVSDMERIRDLESEVRVKDRTIATLRDKLKRAAYR
jgi:hypothetical protein